SLLSAAEVRLIIDQAVAQAERTRAAIRRPIGSPARVFITVVDVDGSVLGIWRTSDATIFSYDVSAQKARTVVAYSNPTDSLGIAIRNSLGFPAGQDIAFTCRAIGFLSQDFYPPGIDEETLDRPVRSGPLFEGPEFRLQEMLGRSPFNGNGITIFPGGIPLYRGGQLVGGIGVSGDGVDQDDIIAAAGANGYEALDIIRCDQFKFDGIRLPYVKFPRRPEL
ncbi:MAG: heme-binding protein, partial [Candidatus Zixiibacteriota bacterium]